MHPITKPIATKVWRSKNIWPLEMKCLSAGQMRIQPNAPHHKTDRNEGLAVEESLVARISRTHDNPTECTPSPIATKVWRSKNIWPPEMKVSPRIRSTAKQNGPQKAIPKCRRGRGAQRQLDTAELGEKAGGHVRDGHPHVQRRLHKANDITELQAGRHCPFPAKRMASCVSTNKLTRNIKALRFRKV